ncbi:MAG: HAMP domain-containing protein [Bacteroidota bacterium]
MATAKNSGSGTKPESPAIKTNAGTLDLRLVLKVLNDYKNGDFSARLPEEWTGVEGKIAETLNDIIEANERLARELEHVSRVVGKEGKLNQRLNPATRGGAWAAITESVNELISDLIRPTSEMARVIGAVAKGDLSQSIAMEVAGKPLRGEFLTTAKTVNAMVEQLGAFTVEVTRVSREVGTEGKLGGQANVKGVAGTWKDLTESVNSMASNLTAQVRNIAEVTIAVASGDLSKKITVDVRGEFLQLKDAINTMVDQLRSFASEVTRVAREVGTEGKLGGQAVVPGVAGTWKDLTDSVNFMASNLTSQVRNIAQVTTAVANGDLSKKITVDARGEILELKNTINVMVDQLGSFASEVTRVAREVGTEGKLGGQAKVQGVGGVWKDLTDNVNLMGSNLTDQVRNVAEVASAIANGDLSKKITVDVKGEMLGLKNTMNTMVDQLNSFSAEVTRVAREVGSEGKLGGQADVRGVSGVWKDLTDSVNSMAGNLTAQVRNIAEVTTAVANGDLSKKITVDVKGEILELKNTINVMVDQLGSFASEVTRVAREVGTEGKLGGQAQVKDVSGTWKDLTDSVNSMAGNLTAQVRNIAEVTTAVANGDLSKKITVDVKGEILELKDTINVMVDQLNSFTAEVTRVAREVGSEGKLGGQADVQGVAGVWKDLTDNVNSMAGNLTTQVRNIAEVTTAVANGDLSKKITADVKGEILELKNTINVMVDQLNSFAAEVTRVAREVGTEGKLGGQADVQGVGGVWKDLTDNVNSMAGNLTGQVRNIAEVTTAVANGDLSKKITADVRGEMLDLKNTINVMVDQLNSFSAEVTRVAREVGTEGKLGGQAEVQGVGGVWKDLTDSVNSMASNLTSQVRNIAEVTTAVANGDLSKKITVDVKGEILELKNTINVMVDQLGSFASEVTRVAREVGTEGKLGGQAQVKDVSGTWKDLTDSVNSMAGNLTSQVRNIAEVTTAVANGDLSKKITVDVKGEILELKNTINVMVDQLRSFGSEVTRVAREVGSEGKLGGQAVVPGVAGVWKDLTDNVNFMASNLTNQVRNIADVTTAVAKGDLTRKITVDVKGEIMELKDTINTMVDQLNSFAAEVTRVAREVGTEGKLGGQAQVPGVSGTWKDLTDSVNIMAANLTDQVRNIAKVVTAVANGDLKKKLTFMAKGEIALLADTINGMIDTLAIFADQVSGVAREVGVEGRLGGQSVVPGAAGTWKDLTDNVNQLAANLTNQVRAMAEVATAVTKGDLTRFIKVEARGEVEELKNNINEMVRNLKETTQTNSEQDWLKTNVAKFTRILQGQRDLLAVARLTLSELAPLVSAQHGIFYIMENGETDNARLKMLASYAFKERKNLSDSFRMGEGIVGQAAFEKQRILLTNVPGDYITISSGLGEAPPLNIIVLPVVFEGQVKAVIELASFERFSSTHQTFLEQLTESLGIVLNTIEASSRTEELLRQSQSLAKELQSQQEELQQTNEELEEKARLLEEQKVEVERKNREVEMAKSALEEKAEQLTVTSKYKSEFLSNMSHELRTPLNSLLILSQQLAENPQGNLSDKQIQFAQTIHSSGNDLLMLINEILDLSKIESGTTTLDISEVPFTQLKDQIDRSFRHIADNKGINFSLDLADNLPKSMATDPKRLQQVIRNLLSNAFKFTDKGEVAMAVSVATSGWNSEHDSLNRAAKVIAISVRDTGIGIPADKQKIIFEAFQQADGSTSRKYGGTGLGLAISREIVNLLGGMIRLDSEQGKGSTFTVFLPQNYNSGSLGNSGNQALPSPSRGGGSRPALKTGGGGGELSDEVKLYDQENRIQAKANKSKSEKTISDKGNTETGDPAKGNSNVVAEGLHDDRNDINPGDGVVLIVEDDQNFAGILMDTAHDKGFKVILALDGESALTAARGYKPSAITLDLMLPDIDGWTVLDRLKMDPETQHIPVHIISAEDSKQVGLKRGAFSYLEKPLTKKALQDAFAKIGDFLQSPSRRLLIVEDDTAEQERMIELIGSDDVDIKAVGTGGEALKLLKKEVFNCIVIDLKLPDMDGLDLIEQIQKNPKHTDVPIIVYTAKDLNKEEEAQLNKMAKSLILKDIKSPVRLLHETSLFLHRVASHMPEEKRDIIKQLYKNDEPLKEKKVLIVDDDVRNIFALTSILERHNMDILTAENGKQAIETLQKNTDVDIVLMDIMMPEMDGYEAMQEIRKLANYKSVPIIALTAKAMKGDREKCVEAGASDYISKPVNTEQLLSLLRVWLYR